MSNTNITRDEAAVRSAGLRLETYHTTVDLRQAPDQGQPRYPVHTVVVLEASITETFLDFLDGEVHRLLVNGERQPVRYDGARIPLTLEAGRNVVEVHAEASYSRSGQGLHRFVDPIDQQTYLYTQFEPADARRVFPNFEQPDLKAAHHISVLAPDGWLVRSNQPRVGGGPVKNEAGELDGVRHAFGPTPPLSTYLTCIIAGPWHQTSSHWRSGDGLEVELGALCRQSLVPHFDADKVFELTKQGLDFYHHAFGYPYPWGKYDQVFVPEYNLGAMENPGLVTFTESYIHRSAATRAQYQGRANTILHEMAHMWFGDLVTPAWWDDLWLKESFAEFMGAHVSVQATEFRDAWVAFAGRRKAWAYAQDQLPTTHPIVADIGDVEAAKQNFDGITYAKGAAVLKQLVAHVGVSSFFAGSRAYFQAHAFGSARLADLLTALEQSSGRDLDSWSRAWLQTAGPDTLSPVLELAEGRINRLGIRQESVDARDGSPVGRPHTLKVGLYRLGDGRLERTESFDVELAGDELTWLADPVGQDAPDLVLVNDEDLTYAKIGLDERSLETVREHLCELSDPLARALVWSALWNMTRDAQLPVAHYVAAVLRHGAAETDVATLSSLLTNLDFAINHYLPAASRNAAAEQAAGALWELLQDSASGSDAQIVLARALAGLAVRARTVAPQLAGLLDGSVVLDGLELGPELRWLFARALVAQRVWGPDELAVELERDPSADGVTAHREAMASRPVAQVKQEVWRELHTPLALSNDHVDALVAGFSTPGQEELGEQSSAGYFDGLTTVWAEHAIEIAQRLVNGLFPSGPDTVERAESWLADNPGAPAALRRLVVEGTDNARRARKAQEFNS
ncbi:MULTISPECIES: aminopeptidase N [unclassified Luteococcus]|uniref:aminopeptidase N n=1 Tax=unclassified Luteococcus TaxID=2639923 RepID=UPI00313C1602